MVHDKDELRNTALFVGRQQKSLAFKMHAAEARLLQYRSSVLAEHHQHTLSRNTHASSPSVSSSNRGAINSEGRLERNEKLVRVEERRAGGKGDIRSGSRGERRGGDTYTTPRDHTTIVFRARKGGGGGPFGKIPPGV